LRATIKCQRWKSATSSPASDSPCERGTIAQPFDRVPQASLFCVFLFGVFRASLDFKSRRIERRTRHIFRLELKTGQWSHHLEDGKRSPMTEFLMYALVPLAVLAVAVVLLLGLSNLARGGSPQRSQKLMRLRVLLQFVAIIVIMLTVWAMGK
jgi:hypothetical protein